MIRTATAEDAERVAEIYVASWNDGFGSLMPRRDVSDDLVGRWRLALTGIGTWRVASDPYSGQVVGFARTRPTTHAGRLLPAYGLVGLG